MTTTALYPSIPTLEDVNSVRGLDAQDRKLIEHLYTLQRSASSSGEAGFKKILNSIGDLSSIKEQHRSGNFVRTIRKFIGSSGSANRDEQPAMLLYPRIIKMDNDERPEILLTTIVTFEKASFSPQQQINLLRELNAPFLAEFFKRCINRPRKIDTGFDQFPGHIVTGGNYEQIPTWHALSVEMAFIKRSVEVLKELGLESYPFALFHADMLYLAAEELKLIKKVHDGLYLPQSSGVIPHDEVIYVYRILADSYERYLRAQITQHAGARTQLKNFDDNNPIEPDRRQNSDRIGGLLQLGSDLLEGELIGLKKPELNSLLALIEKLIEEMNQKFDKIATAKIAERTEELKSMILSLGRKGYDFLKIDLVSIFDDSVFKDPEWTRTNAERVLKNLKEKPDLCYIRQGDQQGPYYFAHLPVLYRIESEQLFQRNEEKTRVVQELIENLQNIRPEVTSYRKLLLEYDESLYAEAMKIQENLKSEKLQKRKAEEGEKKKMDRLLSASTGVLGALAAAGLYATVDDFNPLIALLVAVPGFLVTYGLILSVLGNLKKGGRTPGARHRAKQPSRNERAAPVPEKPGFSADREQLFPRNSSNVMARVYSPKKLLSDIKKLERIRAIQDQKMQEQAIKEFYNYLTGYMVVVRIPEKRLPNNYPRVMYFSKADIRNVSLRKTIITGFKQQAQSWQRQYNQQIADYYNYIASELEFNHTKYTR